MGAGAQPVEGEGARRLFQAIEADALLRNAVNADLRQIVAAAGPRPIGDRVADEGEPGCSQPRSGIRAAAGCGVGCAAPGRAVKHSRVIFLEGSVGQRLTIPGIEEVEIDSVVGCIGVFCPQHGDGNGMGAGDQVVEVIAGRVIQPGVEVNRLHHRAVNGDLRLAAVAVAEEAHAHPGPCKVKANGVAGRFGNDVLASAGARCGCPRPGLRCLGEGKTVVEDGRVILFIAGDGRERRRLITRADGRRDEGVQAGVTVILANLHDVRPGAQPVEGIEPRPGRHAVGAQLAFGNAVNAHLDRVIAGRCPCLISDGIAGEGEPGRADVDVGERAAAGAGVVGSSPGRPIQHTGVVFLERPVGERLTAPHIEEVEIDPVVAGIGVARPQHGDGDGVGPCDQVVKVKAGCVVVARVEVNCLHHRAVNRDLRPAAETIRGKAHAHPTARKVEADGVVGCQRIDVLAVAEPACRTPNPALRRLGEGNAVVADGRVVFLKTSHAADGRVGVNEGRLTGRGEFVQGRVVPIARHLQHMRPRAKAAVGERLSDGREEVR